VDYKSNYLGQRPEDYDASSLEQAMVQHDYPLQYLIYSLALHRYLKVRLPDYDPDEHLGGVLYLFIRGMQPDWGKAGVFYDRLSTDIILALDELVTGVGDE
jgi:exodeoxyribonuclease V beta subunit